MTEDNSKDLKVAVCGEKFARVTEKKCCAATRDVPDVKFAGFRMLLAGFHVRIPDFSYLCTVLKKCLTN